MRSTRLRLTMCATAALGACIGVPAALAATGPGAQSTRAVTPAGSVSVDRACYVNTEKAAAKITVSGTGWSPGDTIELSDSRQMISTTVTASSAGTFSTQVPAPILPIDDAEISDRIEAVDEGSQGATTPGGASAESSSFLATSFAVRRSGSDPLRDSVFEISGFAPNRIVWAHYLTSHGRFLETASFGRATGACGLRRLETHEYPGSRAQTGDYTIQFDDSARYSPRTSPSFRLAVNIRSL